MVNGKVYIKNLRLHAFHGVLPQERIVGNDYVLNIVIDYPIAQACLSDDVCDTVNYAEVAEIAKTEMQKQSNLLENVAYRIAKAIRSAFPLTHSVTVDIRKVTPPMSVDSDGAGVAVTL